MRELSDLCCTWLDVTWCDHRSSHKWKVKVHVRSFAILNRQNGFFAISDQKNWKKCLTWWKRWMVFINRQILKKVTIQVSRRFTDDFRIDILKNVGLFIFICAWQWQCLLGCSCWILNWIKSIGDAHPESAWRLHGWNKNIQRWRFLSKMQVFWMDTLLNTFIL